MPLQLAGKSVRNCGLAGMTSATWTAGSGDPGRGASNKSISAPHYVRFFHSRSALASELATLPGNEKCPAKRPGTDMLLFAERAGFEPAIPFRVYTLSRRAPSTTRTPLQY